MHFSTISFIVYFTTIEVCLCIQTWKEEPSRTEVNPGGTAVLYCKIFDKQGTCSWQKDGKAQGMFIGKYEWSGDRQMGDCSIRIYDAGEVDDGDWECQVTASAFRAQDALTSNVAQLIVRVAPNQPLMEFDSNQVSPGQNFTVTANRPGSIKCVTRYGNPPAIIHWFIGERRLPNAEYYQSNMTEVSRSKTWMSVSYLTHTYAKEDHGLPLKCVAVHQAYSREEEAVQVIMDVRYAPTVSLEGNPINDVEEGVDRVTLKCAADANPSANVIWRAMGERDVFSFQPQIIFDPVSRRHSSIYTCEANNAIGGSNTVSVKVDVKYGARVLQVMPAFSITANLHNRTQMECLAEGNPPPHYNWVQTLPDGRKEMAKSRNSTLVIESVTYEHQGQYVCLASNNIKGQIIKHQSQPIILEVVGAPHILRYTVNRNIEVADGDDAVIQVVFCADPRPSRVTWFWGTMRLEAGNTKGKYVAESLAQDSREDCFTARLWVQSVHIGDARDYQIHIENLRGSDQYTVNLLVNAGDIGKPLLSLRVPPSAEALFMSTVIGAVIVLLVILIFVTLLVLYAFRTEKWCFSL